MKFMKVQVLLLTILFAHSAFSLTCDQVLDASPTPRARSNNQTRIPSLRNLNPFWSINHPILIRTSNIRRPEPLTFSFDSEIPTPEWLGLIHKDEGMRAAFQTFLEKNQRGKAGTQLTPWTLPQIARTLGMSEAQALRFAIRQNVNKTKLSFDSWDLTASALANMVEQSSSRGLFYLISEMHQAVSKYLLQATSLETRSHADGSSVELTHPRYSILPSEFGQKVSILHHVFKHPQTHLHIGIPSEIGDERSLTVARAIEALITVDLVIRFQPGDSYLSFTDGSTLLEVPVTDHETRGVIVYGEREFVTPHTSNNLEIRQWPSISAGLNLLARAAELVINHERLKTVQMTTRSRSINPKVGNLSGALEFISLLLRESPSSRAREVAMQLDRYRTSLDAQRGAIISDTLIVEIGRYLDEQHVADLLTLDVFLNP